MIVAEGALELDGKWKNIHFFPYTMLRKRWRTTLLSTMKVALNPELFDLNEFNRLVNKLYSDKSNGFYFHVPGTDLEANDAIVNYVTRYIGRPVMAQSRTTNYDGTYVTYWYQRHEDNKTEYVTEHAFEFIMFMNWRFQIDISFGRDPLKCKCAQTMELSGIYIPPPSMLQYAYLLKRGT